MTANQNILDRYVELYKDGDLDGIMDLYAEDAVQLMPDGTFEGRSAIRARLAREMGGFSEIGWTVDSFVDDGDSFADEWTFIGTHRATGKRVEIKGMELVEVRDGKIVVDNLYYDNLSVATQLGLVPEEATAAL